MGRLDDDEREVFGGVVNESKEAVGARQFERFLFNIELLLDLVAHLLSPNIFTLTTSLFS
jgi:hypothetical protein